MLTLPIHRCRGGLCAAVVFTLLLAPLSAHEVVVEQRAEITFQPQGDRLTVSLHLPVSLTGDRELAELLTAVDAAAAETRLRVVAADIAHNLDVEQREISLPPPGIRARRGADAASLDIDLSYAAVNDAPFSARLNAFTSTTAAPVRTTARFLAPSGRVDLVSVTGPPARVVFDPPAAMTAQQFAVRGLRALTDGGDHLLWLVCALLLLRTARSTLTLFAAVVAAQTVAIAASSAVPAAAAAWVPAAGLIAASAIAIAAMQNVVDARWRWVLPVAVVFGALNGLAFGDTIAGAAQFAGGHRSIALVVFTAVVVAGELWLGTLGWLIRRWLDEQGVPARGFAILGSAFIAHDALHRMALRGDASVVEWVALAWAAAIVLAGIVNAVQNPREVTA